MQFVQKHLQTAENDVLATLETVFVVGRNKYASATGLDEARISNEHVDSENHVERL
jgi:hypothetical protein